MERIKETKEENKPMEEIKKDKNYEKNMSELRKVKVRKETNKGKETRRGKIKTKEI
jgi:hypothetical protein